MNSRLELISVAEMYEADRLTIEGGVPGEMLMENAGKAIADVVVDRFPTAHVHVLCGPGNNGGDGFVAARHLMISGRDVSLYLFGSIEDLKGDAAIHANRWRVETGGETQDLASCYPSEADIVIDCLFGAGLGRDVGGEARGALERADAATVVACDLPSGINGDSGAVLGFAPKAAITVTFARMKPGHLLLPGRIHCGETIVADIGIPDAVIERIAPQTALNGPALWMDTFPRPDIDAHKFARGHLQIVGGDKMTGAARLSARAARRIGAGLATILSPEDAADIYRTGDPGSMVEVCDSADELRVLLQDARRNVIVVGPGNGVTVRTRDMALAALQSQRSVVLDADALSVFKGKADELFDAVDGPTVLTPHEGEFARVFDEQIDPAADKLTRTREAAAICGAVVLLKGPDTVIASPDGRAIINTTGSPWLATAGSGDVLAGVIGALMAQGIPAFEAACAGVWLHGRAGETAGPGLIAEDLPEALTPVISGLYTAV